MPTADLPVVAFLVNFIVLFGGLPRAVGSADGVADSKLYAPQRPATATLTARRPEAQKPRPPHREGHFCCETSPGCGLQDAARGRARDGAGVGAGHDRKPPLVAGAMARGTLSQRAIQVPSDISSLPLGFWEACLFVRFYDPR